MGLFDPVAPPESNDPMFTETFTETVDSREVMLFNAAIHLLAHHDWNPHTAVRMALEVEKELMERLNAEEK